MGQISVTVTLELRTCPTCGCVWGHTAGLSRYDCPSCAVRDRERRVKLFEDLLAKFDKKDHVIAALRGVLTKAKKVRRG